MKEGKPYSGSTRKLIIAFDVGTTFSGVSYTVLEPGLVPEITGVTRFPCSEETAGNAKIPTAIYYDRHGKVRAAGAEVNDGDKIEKAREQKWFLCELFKLHVKCPDLTSGTTSREYALGELPPNKTVVDVYSDFLQYLMKCTTIFVQETTPGGTTFWASVEEDLEFVLTHPNGWEGPEQALIREAAIQAGLIQDTFRDHARVHFVTEGEASLHFCVFRGLNMPKKGVIIVDAGGGTVDLSAYCNRSKSSRYQEVAIPKSVFAGSRYVTAEAKKFFERMFLNTRFKDDIPRITKIFDTTAKRAFSEDTKASFISFGTHSDNDEELGVNSGHLKLSREVVASFFNPAVKETARAILEQQIELNEKVTDVFLVGGFASSSWLFQQLRVFLEPFGFTLLRPDRYINKAVADGAIWFYLNHIVTSRISRRVYGARCIRDYIASDPEHRKREDLIEFSCTGKRELHNGFDIILGKDIRISESEELRRPYYLERKQLGELTAVTAEIMVYEGEDRHPQWLDTDEANFRDLFKITADTTAACQGLRPRKMNGRKYYRLDYEVVLSLGLTELKAQVCWKQGGIEKRSPARIIYIPRA